MNAEEPASRTRPPRYGRSIARMESSRRPPLRHWRTVTLVLVLVLPLVLLLLGRRPLAQDARYHAFADGRSVVGIPNFADVVSSLPFLMVGVLGLRWCARGAFQGAQAAWTVFFAAVACIAIGSAYYHWAPTDATLVWDRLPMAIACMSLLVALLEEHMTVHLERKLLGPALLAGAASVAWWHYTGDLRWYVWVQLAPLLAIAVLLLLYRGRYSHRGYLLYALLGYVLAKAAEFRDAQLFSLTDGTLSGHTMKHLLAALALCCAYLMLRARTMK